MDQIAMRDREIRKLHESLNTQVAENVRLRKALLEIEWFSKGLSRGDDAGQCGRYVLSLADAALAASNNKGNGT